MKYLLIGLTLFSTLSATAGVLSKSESVTGVICEFAENHELAYRNLNGRLKAGNVTVNSIRKVQDRTSHSSTPISELKSVSAPSFSHAYKFAENKDMFSACVTVSGLRKF
jgi:hypothetical protein